MAHINLLPWRVELRKQRNKDFYTLIGVVAGLMLVIIAVVHLQIQSQIDHQNRRNSFLNAEIKIVDSKIEAIQDLERRKQQLISRMEIIERLQSNRPEVVHLFDELAHLVPDGLYLIAVTQKSRLLTIKGVAQSNARVSAFMRALDQSIWFDEPNLLVIKAEKQGFDRSREFTLIVKQASQNQEEDSEKEKKSTKGKKGKR
ncbi:MAG: PilN domain-containing protein [Gammaproteobacteria bacterium]|nr:PilN domain-containing protein [Gammaproteobacteria bacterium]